MNQTYLNSPKVTPAIPPARPIHWTVLGVAAIAAGTIISLVDIIKQLPSRPAPIQAALPVPAPTPVALAMPTPAPLVIPTPEPLAPRAELVPIDVRRALPVEGSLYLITMPDGTHPLIRFMGAVRDFGDLPKNPALWDFYQIASSGHSWVFMQPAGFSAPAWVDP